MIALTLCISVIKKTISNVRISVSLQRVEEPSFSLVKKDGPFISERQGVPVPNFQLTV